MNVGRMIAVVGLALGVMLGAMTACSSNDGAQSNAVDPDSSPDAAAQACVPGQQTTCACASGASGFQVCEATGASFGACDCSEAKGGEDAAADANEILVVPTNGLVAHYRGSGIDLSGHGNTLDVHGVTPTMDRFGQSLAGSFAGDDQSYMQGLNLPSLPEGTTFSVSAWIKTTSANGGVVSIAHGDIAGFGGTGVAVYAGIAAFSADGTQIQNGKVVADGTWHHLAAVYDGVTVNLYVDNSLGGSGAATLTLINTPHLGIGVPIISSSYFNGSIDDIRVYDRALSATDIEALFKEVK